VVSNDDLATSKEVVPWEDGNFVAITQSAAYWTRNWGPGRWARVIQWLSNKGVKVVAIGLDRLDLRHHENLYPTEVLNYTGKDCPPLGVSAAIIKRCKVFASVDTGTAHIAVGFGIPTVVASGPTQAEMCFSEPAVGVYAQSPHKCRGCFQRNARYSNCKGKIDCMASLPVLKVAEKIGELYGIKPERPTVSLCMIVKNEMKTLPECLESVKGCVDEIVVVDTGSTDGTRKWIADRPWIRDFEFDVGEKIQSFSEPRNVSISHATGKYVLWLDAVERLMDPKRLKTIVQSGIADVYTMMIFHENARYTREKIVPRVFARFEDRVHEFIPTHGLMDARVPEGACVMRKVVPKVNRENSCERNIRLEKMMLEESPIDHPRRPRWLYYIGRDLFDMNRIDEGLEYLKERVNLVGFVEERVCAAVLLARAYLYHYKDFQNAAKVGEMIVRLKPDWREGYYIRGEAFYWDSKYLDSKFWYERALAIKKPLATMWLWDPVYQWLVQDRLSRVCEYLGNVDGAITYAMQELKHAPASEHQWMSERLKKLSGVPTLT
jgi:glycosyltransferase involved in cell wall biosynthesis